MCVCRTFIQNIPHPHLFPHSIPAQVTVPGGHVFVGEARGDVKHDDGALAVDVVPITQPTKLFLTGCVPAVEADLATVGGKVKWVDLYSNGGCVEQSVQISWCNM